MSLSDEIARMNRAWDQGISNHDLDLVMEQYAPDAKMFPPGSPMIDGAEAIRRLVEANSDAGVKAVEHETISIDGYEDFAVVVARYRLSSGTVRGDHKVVVGKSLYVVKRQPDGVLRVAYDAFSDDQVSNA